VCVLGLNNVGTRRSCLRNTGQAHERVGEPVAGSRRYATVVSVSESNALPLRERNHLTQGKESSGSSDQVLPHCYLLRMRATKDGSWGLSEPLQRLQTTSRGPV
jgi:hypothetical protein